VAALVWAALFSPAAPTQASPTNVYAIGCEFLVESIDGNLADVPTLADVGSACDGITPVEAEAIEFALGDGDGFWDPGELDSVEFDENQIRDGALALAVPPAPRGLLMFALLNDDDDVVFDPGLLGPDASCASLLGSPAGDEDCDGDGFAGDGLVIHAIGDATGLGGAVDPGDSPSVSVTQNSVEISLDINIVSGPDEIVLAPLDVVVETQT
jgi:hypothetical protein